AERGIMPGYTTNWAIPYPVASDLIAGNTENLRIALQNGATRTDQAITAATDAANAGLDSRLTVVESVAATAPHVRGTLDASVSLDSLTAQADNGYWTIGSANSNPGLPATPGVAAKLLVENTSN